MEKELRSYCLRFASGVVLIGIAALTALAVSATIIQELRKPIIPPMPQFATADRRPCNIAVVPLVGELFASEGYAAAQKATDKSATVSAEHILQTLERAAQDRSIRGVVLRIDSNGGVGGDLIASALQRLGKPSVAVIVSQGNSSAYEAATGATSIIATSFADVGDIGVTASYLDKSGENRKNGERFIQLSAGRFKDAGNADRPLSAEEHKQLQHGVDLEYELFVREVARNRRMSYAEVLALANGSSYLGVEAVKNRLVDSLGDTSTAGTWFEKRLGHGFKVVLCE